MLDEGTLDDAERWLRAAERAADLAGERMLGALVDMGWGYLFTLRGEPQRAREALQRSVLALDEAEMPQRTVVPRCWLAVDAHRQGAVQEANAILEIARACCPPDASPGTMGVLGLAARTVGVTGLQVPPEALRQPWVRVARTAFATR
jgi:hypothetical protein